jgi:hypothetical protein
VAHGRHDEPVTTGSETALAEAAAIMLKPILAEIDQKLDRISEKMEFLLTELTRTAEVAARLADRVDSRQGTPLGGSGGRGNPVIAQAGSS